MAYAYIPAQWPVIVTGPSLPGGPVIDEATEVLCCRLGVDPGEICLTRTPSGPRSARDDEQVVEVRREDGSIAFVRLADVVFAFPIS